MSRHAVLQLGLGPTYGFDELVAAVQRERGRPLRVREYPPLRAADGGSLCGLWLATDEEDIILHAPSDSQLHTRQFVLHELAHIALRHDLRDDARSASAERLIPDLGGARLMKALGRGGRVCQDPIEEEAENLADEFARAIRTHERRRPTRFDDVFG